MIARAVVVADLDRRREPLLLTLQPRIAHTSSAPSPPIGISEGLRPAARTTTRKHRPTSRARRVSRRWYVGGVQQTQDAHRFDREPRAGARRGAGRPDRHGARGDVDDHEACSEGQEGQRARGRTQTAEHSEPDERRTRPTTSRSHSGAQRAADRPEGLGHQPGVARGPLRRATSPRPRRADRRTSASRHARAPAADTCPRRRPRAHGQEAAPRAVASREPSATPDA